MDQIITKHLQNMTVKPRPESWFRNVAEDLGQKSTPNPKAVVRATISKGQVAASNDNIELLKKQAQSAKGGSCYNCPLCR